MTRRLILLRHGQTDYNATGRMQGHYDSSLSDVGRAQARAVVEPLRSFGITRILSSDLTRAHDTATPFAEALGLPVEKDRRLRETDLGEWQEKTSVEVDAAHPGARAIWRRDVNWAPPGGETHLQVGARARAVVDELMTRYDDWDSGAVLIVAHCGTLKALTAALLNIAPEQLPILNGPDNCHWAKLTARPPFYPGSRDALGDADQIMPEAIFTPENVTRARWYLDVWNAGVNYPAA